ncbi:unnamed protein product, partial [Mesorhabditis spiculigera]
MADWFGKKAREAAEVTAGDKQGTFNQASEDRLKRAFESQMEAFPASWEKAEMPDPVVSSAMEKVTVSRSHLVYRLPATTTRKADEKKHGVTDSWRKFGAYIKLCEKQISSETKPINTCAEAEKRLLEKLRDENETKNEKGKTKKSKRKNRTKSEQDSAKGKQKAEAAGASKVDTGDGACSTSSSSSNNSLPRVFARKQIDEAVGSKSTSREKTQPPPPKPKPN